MTYGSETWSLLSKHEKKLATTEMKMLRMSAGVTLLDHIKSNHIRGSLQVKKTVLENVHEERITWFEKVYQHSDENVTKRAISLDVPPVRKPGAPKTTWKRQMKKNVTMGWAFRTPKKIKVIHKC